MPSILSEDDKQTVKRTVPKASNKIHAVAVAKLFIAYPNRNRWTYTGLQGAVVLANDLVGNTFWIKLVDVSPANRGVMWDQEIYDTFQYNQDRTFFHSFELEDCLAGLSFADEKEAKQFKKKMEEREKNAHKNTRAKPFASGPAQTAYNDQPAAQVAGGKQHSRFGLSNLLGSHKSHSPSQQTPPQSIIPPRGVEVHSPTPVSPAVNRNAPEGIDLNDPAVQEVLRELKGMGITEDQIEEHAAFIKTYLAQHKAQAAVDQEKIERAARAPPPPPAGADLSPQHTGSSGGASKRGPPPAAPPPRRGNAPQRPPSPSPSPPREPSPPRPRFRAPPPIADAGRFANEPRPTPPPPSRDSHATNAPAPPPRPPKTPLDDDSASAPAQSGRFAVPPPFTGNRISSGSGGPPPPPPARSGAPPAPPPREVPVAAPGGVPPPPPPRVPNAVDSTPPPPPPLPPSSSRPVPPAPAAGAPLPPPPPPMPSSSGPPPPPPMPPSTGGPPPPPPMPPRSQATGVDNDSAAALPKAAVPGRDGLLADIRGGPRLKKVSDSEKRDRSAAMVPGGEAAAPPPSAPGAPAGAAAQGGLAGALASALAARKSKVGDSDDEDDKDDW